MGREKSGLATRYIPAMFCSSCHNAYFKVIINYNDNIAQGIYLVNSLMMFYLIYIYITVSISSDLYAWTH